MKKKIFREKYADNVQNVEVFEEKIEEPKLEVVIEEPKKRGRKKSVK